MTGTSAKARMILPIPRRLTRRQLGGALIWAAVGLGARTRPAGADDPTERVAARAAAIAREHGLAIGFGDPASFFVPPFGPADAVIPDGEATRAAVSDLWPALDGVAQSLALYPTGLYARFCQAVFLCGSLRFGGVRAGGTFGPAWIILAADPGVGVGGIRETARLGVHHEFSSLVLPRVRGLATRWAALLPAGWRPVQSVSDALGHSGEADGSDGFLSAYATTSVENDFNTYAETIFGDPTRLLTLAARFEVVRRKTSLLLGAYVSLDARLRATFGALGFGHLPIEKFGEPMLIHIRPSYLPPPSVSRGR